MGDKIVSKLSDELFQVLRGSGRQITLFDETGNIVYDPTQARRFFAEPDKMMVSIQQDGSDSTVKLYMSDGTEIEGFTTLINTLRNICVRYNMLFNIRTYGHQLSPKNFAYLAAMESVMEQRPVVEASQLYGTTKSSYQKIGNARLVIRHSASINEQSIGARSRRINSIFVENALGERFRFPVVHLNGARAMAYHLSQGGRFYDSIGETICSLSEQFSQINQVRKHIRNEGLLESSQNEIGILESQLREISNIFIRAQRPRGYEWFTQQYQAESVAEDIDVTEIAERFKIDEDNSLRGSLKWVAHALSKQGDASMNAVTEREVPEVGQEDKFVKYAQQYYLARLKRAGEVATLTPELQKNSSDLATGLKQILSGNFLAKAVGANHTTGSFSSPNAEKAYKIGLFLEPASGLHNDALWNYLADIADKLEHNEALTKNEQLVSDRVVSFADAQLSQAVESFIESEETVDEDELEEAALEPAVDDRLPELARMEEWFEKFDPTSVLSQPHVVSENSLDLSPEEIRAIKSAELQGQDVGSIARKYGISERDVLDIANDEYDLKEAKEGDDKEEVEESFFDEEVVEAVEEEEEEVEESVESLEEFAELETIASEEVVAEGSDGGSDSFQTTIMDPRTGVEIPVKVEYHWDNGNFSTGLDFPSVHSYGHNMEIENITVLSDGSDFPVEALAADQLAGLEEEAWRDLENKQVEEAIIADWSGINNTVETASVEAAPTAAPAPTVRLPEGIDPAAVNVVKAIWDHKGNSDKIWSLLEYNGNYVAAWGKRNAGSTERSWRQQALSLSEAQARLSTKLNEGYKEVVSEGRVTYAQSVSQLNGLLPFLKEVGARVFSGMNVVENSNGWTEVADVTEANKSQDFIDDVTTEDDQKEVDEAVASILRLARITP